MLGINGALIEFVQKMMNHLVVVSGLIDRNLDARIFGG